MEQLRHPSETPLFIACVIVSVLIYIGLAISIIGLLYGVLIAIGLFVSHGLMVGAMRGNGVRVSDAQFTDLHRRVIELSTRLGLAQPPEVYVQQEGGLLNAFATRFLGRDFVVLYSDVMEVAYEQGEDVVAFILAHELGHVRRRHMNWRWLLMPSLFVPFLGTAYQRACEYTCDRIGTHLAPAGAIPGLLLLAAGKLLYKRVDAQKIVDQIEDPPGFWVSLAEWVATHPHLANRLNAVASFQASGAGAGAEHGAVVAV